MMKPTLSQFFLLFTLITAGAAVGGRSIEGNDAPAPPRDKPMVRHHIRRRLEEEECENHYGKRTSSDPSCAPSPAPIDNTPQPTTTPQPSTTPSQVPSEKPSESKTPSFAPSNMPTEAPSDAPTKDCEPLCAAVMQNGKVLSVIEPMQTAQTVQEFYGYEASILLPDTEVVKISEVKYTPAPGCSTENGRWIEIYNGGSNDVDLSGWTLRVDERTNVPLSRSLHSGHYFTICSASTCCAQEGDHFEADFVAPSFADLSPKETITLRDNNLETVDEYTYGAKTSADGATETGAEFSMRRKQSTLNSHIVDTDNDRLDWEIDRKPTPGSGSYMPFDSYFSHFTNGDNDLFSNAFHVMLHQDTSDSGSLCDIGLVMVADGVDDVDGGELEVTVTGDWTGPNVVQDEPTSSFIWDADAGTTTISWAWDAAEDADGAAKTFSESEFRDCIQIHVGESTNIDFWYFLDGPLLPTRVNSQVRNFDTAYPLEICGVRCATLSPFVTSNCERAETPPLC